MLGSRHKQRLFPGYTADQTGGTEQESSRKKWDTLVKVFLLPCVAHSAHALAAPEALWGRDWKVPDPGRC